VVKTSTAGCMLISSSRGEGETGRQVHSGDRRRECLEEVEMPPRASSAPAAPRLRITKGSALEIPQNTDDASNQVLGFQGQSPWL